MVNLYLQSFLHKKKYFTKNILIEFLNEMDNIFIAKNNMSVIHA